MTSQVNQYSGSASLQYFSVDPPAVGGANTPVVAGGAPSSASAAAEAGLTPEALMAYCAAALNGLDSQMEDIFNTQQKDNKLVTDINAAAGTFSQYQNGINYSGNAQSTSVPGSATDPSTPFGALTTQLSNLVTEAGGPNTELGGELQNALTQLTTNTHGGVDATVSDTDVAAIVKDLQNAASDANSGAELNMVKLQSLMSDRQSALQMCTNLVQSLGQQQNAIASNIGK